MVDDDDDSATFVSKKSLFNTVSIVKKGILLKKGMGRVFRPWNLRTIIVDTENKFTYIDRDEVKGK